MQKFNCRLVALTVFSKKRLGGNVAGLVVVGIRSYRSGEAKTAAGIYVLAPRDIEDGQVLYEDTAAHWPKSAEDLAEILGLGTRHPLLNIDKDFAIVLEKLSGA